MKFLLVFLGSGIGGVIRYGISLGFISSNTKFPWATLIANIVAAFLVGLFYAMAAQKQWLDKNLLLLLTVGLCGGLSTFSTFSLETLKLWQSHQHLIAIMYIVLSVVTSILFVFIGNKMVEVL
jgi:fluoride exporter